MDYLGCSFWHKILYHGTGASKSMFYIKIAGVKIGIDNRYPYTRWICQDFVLPPEESFSPDFTVRASDARIRSEYQWDPNIPDPPHLPGGLIGFYEGECLFEDICHHMLFYDAFLLHAAVVAVDGIAYAFTAPSGTGKTTHMQLWLDHFGSRAQVVNGDKVMIRIIDGKIYACSTPWKGKENLGENYAMLPLGAVCFIEQCPTNHIEKLSFSDVSRRIFKQVPIPRNSPDYFDQFWNLLSQMMNSMDFYLLRCNRDPEASRLSYLTMRKSKS